jgi:SAM-dependent methyltransferase
MSGQATGAASVIWHDVECGGYAADLASFEALARQAAGPVLELGAGTGRVALHLARAGHEVTAIDREAALLDALSGRARAEGLAVASAIADARSFSLPSPFALVIAPMQLLQVVGDAPERASLLRSVRDHLAAGGAFAAAILAPGALAAADPPGTGAPPLPDIREVDGRVYSSLPVAVAERAGAVEVTRLRQTVAPDGTLTEAHDVVRLFPLTVERLESEAAGAGFRARERIEIPPTADHVGSTIVVTEAVR